ncbi:hypothetical protein A2U01_0092816, partial [Trifolium medium]|nr:hypothetical protein [Trifolium medium]
DGAATERNPVEDPWTLELLAFGAACFFILGAP